MYSILWYRLDSGWTIKRQWVSKATHHLEGYTLFSWSVKVCIGVALALRSVVLFNLVAPIDCQQICKWSGHNVSRSSLVSTRLILQTAVLATILAPFPLHGVIEVLGGMWNILVSLVDQRALAHGVTRFSQTRSFRIFAVNSVTSDRLSFVVGSSVLLRTLLG